MTNPLPLARETRRGFFQWLSAAFAQGLSDTGKNLPLTSLRCPVCRKGDQFEVGRVVTELARDIGAVPIIASFGLHQLWCPHCGVLWARQKWADTP